MFWSAQAAIARDLVTARRVAVRSGHKVGKTLGVAALALWWIMTRERGNAILTSAGDAQVKTQIWKEVRKIWRASGGDDRFKPRLPLPETPSTGLRLDDVRSVYGFTTRDAERIAGHSGDQLLFCVDEASGFPTELFEAVIGNLAGGGAVLATGNPTQTSGWFFDAFFSKRRLWSLHHVDSRTTPNAAGGTPIPGLATAQYVREMIDEYGGGDVARAEEHPVFAVRVAGNFPTAGSRAVVPMGALERAQSGWPDAKPLPAVLELGVDVARFGEDDSVIKPRRGLYAFPSIVVHGYDTIEVAGAVFEAIALHEHLGEARKPIVKIDASGGYGGGVIDHLMRSGRCIVVPVGAGEGSDVVNSTGGKRFVNRRAELWWAIREWIDSGGVLPREPDLEGELLSVTYDYDVKLRIKVESKDDIKKRLGRSPDRADALALAVWNPHGLWAATVAQPDLSHVDSRGPTGLNARGRGRGAW